MQEKEGENQMGTPRMEKDAVRECSTRVLHRLSKRRSSEVSLERQFSYYYREIMESGALIMSKV